ncbi:MAG: AraC family transcriptional regulator [Achromobacter sp.]
MRPRGFGASQVGYESTAAFRRVFRREMGVTPAEFRRGGTLG